MTSKNFKISLHPPPATTLILPTASNPQPPSNPPLLTDALTIRRKVFIEEQHCSADDEIDADDARTWHWVVYAPTADSAADTSTPVATIRLVPPPQPPHELLTQAEIDATQFPRYDFAHEPCVKLTRVAVLKGYRGLGLGRVLVEAALGWARSHAAEIQEAYGRVCGESGGEALVWTGLVLVHAQVQGEKMYARFGFETDDALGRWDEEGIEHVGMWRRIELE
ncbi:GNAT family N-acetyltransferase [Aspergillus clavatus NRRL 1]|uniref:Glucosamine 6-phosphate N-acetyltransferase n=1 Tax=Aspergillus clavatus (strain ATCC 1007 / CBS 513.65 / DSM 816 / NCTC 3887 / NRRL 1 / QM 1276 / 107) TaxID=344612 RepID=A1CNB8_ASPCL|nr:acetyltransferase, GNAT family, putative [Aspergillus clavatus NRRL 1]EAW07139.1 acetyltransferase, GNAT family, putative [Aspergillus clavatus NRRL 1]